MGAQFTEALVRISTSRDQLAVAIIDRSSARRESRDGQNARGLGSTVLHPFEAGAYKLGCGRNAARTNE
jgi:hypothetical protein